MRRTSWLLGAIFTGALPACSNEALNGTAANSADAGGTADATIAAEAGSDASTPTLGADSGPDATTPQGEDSGGGGVADAAPGDAGSSLVSASSVDFGLVACGSTAAAQTFEVVNPTASSVSWSATLGLGAASAFALSPSSGTLGAKQSVQVTVTPSAVSATASTAANALGDVATVNVGASSAAVALTETAQGAVLAFEPSTLAFGPVPLSLGPQSLYFAVQNSGNLAASVTLTLTGDPSLTLPDAGTSETLSAPGGNIVDSQLTYAPTTTTSITGSVALSVSGSPAMCGPLPAAMSVSGTGTNGAVGLSPTSILFGQGGLVPCGTTAAPSGVTLSNTGNAPYNFTAALTHGGSFYTVSPASGTLAAGASSTLTVTPKTIPTSTPTTPGGFDDTLNVTTNVVGDSPHTVSLVETAQGAIVARPSGSLGFGSVGLGATITNSSTVTFANTGNVDATLTFTNGDAVFVQTTPLILGAGTFASETIAFSPTQLVAYSDVGTVTLAPSEDGGVTPLCGTLPGNLTLSGTGVTPTLTASPGSLNFGYVPCGQTGAPLQVSITNNGPTGTYTASVLKGAGSYFTVSPTSGTLTTGVPITFTVTPQTLPMPGTTSSNFYGDTLQVVSSTGDIVDVALNQTALGAVLVFNKTSPFSLGTAPADGGAPSTAALIVTNNGTAPAAVTLTPSPTGTYEISPASATTIPASGAEPYTVSFTPPATGANGGSLALTVSPSTLLCAALPANLTLSGTGD